MSDEVSNCLNRVVGQRKAPSPMVDGDGGFVWLNDKARKGLRPMAAMDWEHIFKHAVDKYNGTYKLQLPKITPHI